MAEPDYDLVKTPGWGEDDSGELIGRKGEVADKYFSDFALPGKSANQYGLRWAMNAWEIKYIKTYAFAKRLFYCPNSSEVTHKNLTTNVEKTIGIDSGILAGEFEGGSFHEFSQDVLDKTWCFVNGLEQLGGPGREKPNVYSEVREVHINNLGEEHGLKLDDVYNIETSETITCASKEYVSCIFVGKGEITISSNTYSEEDHYFIDADTSVDIEVSDNTSFIRFSCD
tara:strand:- start:4072 stop:4752 length:681 start_codon:yes stop_codon:yes gene_type:complete